MGKKKAPEKAPEKAPQAGSALGLSARMHASIKAAPAFKRIFGLNMKDYYDPYLGFDVIKLSDELKVPAKESMRDFIAKKFGQEAVDLLVPLF